MEDWQAQMVIFGGFYEMCFVCKRCSVRWASVRCSNHKNNLLLLVYFIEKSPWSDSIPPGVRLKVFKFFDIRPKVWMVPQLRIDEFSQFVRKLSVAWHDNMLQIFLKPFSFENSIFIQRNVPLGCVLHLNLP